MVVVWSQASAQEQYTLVDLGMGPFQSVSAQDLNESGRVVGSGVISSERIAFVWEDGVYQLLAESPNTSYGTIGRAVNESGRVVGTSGSGFGSTFPVWWDASTLAPTSTTAGNALDINDSGILVGSKHHGGYGKPYSSVSDTFSNTLLDRGGYNSGRALAINNSGQIAGWVHNAGGNTYGAFWAATGASVKMLDAVAITRPVGRGINAAGLIVGAGTLGGKSRAAVWPTSNSPVQDLGALNGGTGVSFARGVNNSATIVGYSEAGGGQDRAVAWKASVDPSTGAMAWSLSDLNDLIPASSGWVLESAGAVNDAGWIVGTGINPQGAIAGFLLKPSAGQNEPPVACAGPDVSGHTGDEVVLPDYSVYGTCDDNTPSELLDYLWSLEDAPLSSNIELDPVAAAQQTLHFTPDVPGCFELQLTVMDDEGLSDTDQVFVSSNNLAPTTIEVTVAATVFIGDPVTATVAFVEPEGDCISSIQWSFKEKPTGSDPVLSYADQGIDPCETPVYVSASYVPDLPGTYTLEATVCDAYGACGSSGPATTVAVDPLLLAASQIMAAIGAVAGLPPSDVTTKGNQKALVNHLSQALAALQSLDLDEARSKLGKAIARVDGCAVSGFPDGPGPGRDWVTSCDAQVPLYLTLMEALELL
jgi:hypothetical protein